MNTSINEKRELLCQAIKEKRLVQFKYDGRSRIVEPFCCGKDALDNYILRGFQIRGSDKTKQLCWRLYDLAQLSQLSITQHGFQGKRENYNLNDPKITEVFCHIS